MIREVEGDAAPLLVSTGEAILALTPQGRLTSQERVSVDADERHARRQRVVLRFRQTLAVAQRERIIAHGQFVVEAAQRAGQLVGGLLDRLGALDPIKLFELGIFLGAGSGFLEHVLEVRELLVQSIERGTDGIGQLPQGGEHALEFERFGNLRFEILSKAQ